MPLREAPRDRDMCAKKVLEVKTYAPNRADKPCHGSSQGRQSTKIKMMGKSTSRHLELDALGIGTCID